MKRGRLKVFLGYASGVGKSHKLLDEARRRRSRGEDVVVAAVQENLPEELRHFLPALEVLAERRTGNASALDMERIVRRRPRVCVVDPLARDNPPGSRHPWRWQDVMDLLENGISVLTSINLVHIAELHRQVSDLTGKVTSETVPKSFLESADEIVIVDAPLDMPADRAARGRSGPAMEDDRRRQLSRLREMTLLLAAEVVERQLDTYATEHGIGLPWGTQERILVCITPRSAVSAMIASGERNRRRFQGELHVVHVRQRGLSDADRVAVEAYLSQARQAGAEVHVLEGRDPVSTILDFARAHRITQLYIGHSSDKGWVSRLRGDPAARLIRSAGDIDVCVFPHVARTG